MNRNHKNVNRDTASCHVMTAVCPPAGAAAAETLLREKLKAETVTIEKPGAAQVWIESYWPDAATAAAAARSAAEYLPDCHIACRRLPREDWSRFWRHHFHPLQIGRIRVVPSWANEVPGPLTIRLDPGLSFGTGLHFTTKFCLEALDSLAAKTKNPLSLLDLGAGSGLLSIAGARLGFKPVKALENDPLAVDAGRANLRLNGLLETVELVSGDAREGLQESYDVICANLFGTLLQTLMPQLVRCTRQALVLSGIREQEAEKVGAAAAACGARERVRDGDGEWCGIICAPGKDDGKITT